MNALCQLWFFDYGILHLVPPCHPLLNLTNYEHSFAEYTRFMLLHFFESATVLLYQFPSMSNSKGFEHFSILPHRNIRVRLEHRLNRNPWLNNQTPVFKNTHGDSLQQHHGCTASPVTKPPWTQSLSEENSKKQQNMNQLHCRRAKNPANWREVFDTSQTFRACFTQDCMKLVRQIWANIGY